MTDDRSAKDSARDPARGALGAVGGGIRAAAKKAAKKIAKKAGQKKTTKKTASAARTTKKAAKREKPASGRTAAASRTGSARTSTAKSAAAGARAETAPKTRSAGAAASSGGVASAAIPPGNGPSFEASRPPAPMHPGASLDSMHEHSGGLVSMLALWGPVIIIGFLVLVLRGIGEREETAAVASDAASQVAAGTPNDPARGPLAAEPAAGARPAERLPGYPGTGRGAADAFDSGFTMRTSMASPPAYTGRDPSARMPASARARLYPSPPGPYREPRYRGLPTGESWSASSSEWRWPADAPRAPGYEDGGDRSSVQWVRCAPPYYWCPAPSKPAW